MKQLFGLITLLLITSGAWAQTYSVSGKVLDAADQSPLIGAGVQLTRLQADSTKIGTAVDPEGNFAVPGVKPGSYRMVVSFLGFETQKRTVTVTNQNVAVGTLSMKAGGVTLKNVEVVGQAAAAVQKGDTAEFNSRAFKTNPDATAEDLVTKMPGITRDADGKMQAQGEQVQRVLVDGKEFFGNDPDAVLKNLPAEIIDKIQVYDRASDQSQFTGFDDGNQQKTINIVTKPQFRNGQFGRVMAGAGPKADNETGRYRVSGNINSFKGKQRMSVLAMSNNVNEQNFGTEDLLGVVGNSSSGGGGRRGGRGGGGGSSGGNAGDFLVGQNNGISRTNAVGINYSNTFGTKVDVQGSYFFNISDNTTGSRVLRDYNLPENVPALSYTENQGTNSRNINNRGNLRLNYKIDSANSILWQPRFSVQRNISYSDLLGRTFRPAFSELGEIERGYNSSNRTASNTGMNLSNQLLFRHRFAKRGRTVSVGLNTTFNNRHGNTYLMSDGYSVQELRNPTRDTTTYTSLDQYSRLEQLGWAWQGNVNYTEPLSEKSMLQLEYALQYTPNDSDKKTYDFDETTGAYSNQNEQLSNVFRSSYVTNSGGINYRYNDKTLQWSVGTNVQYASLRTDQEFPIPASTQRNFLNLLPNASLRYNFSRQQNLRLNYRMRTSPPSLSQLQEVVNNANPLQQSTGNPDLRQQYQHSLFARFSSAKPEKSSSLFFLLGGDYTDNYITNSTYIAAVDTVVYGARLTPGAQLTRPVNLNNRYSIRSAVNYSLPLKLIKSNLNLGVSANYAQSPGLVYDALNYNRTPSFGLNVALSSNISPEIDFTLASHSSQSYSRNSLPQRVNTDYFRQNTTLRLSWIVYKGITVKSDINHTAYSGLAAGFNQNYVRWNASIGKKIFARQQGEIQLYAFDLLKQNRSVNIEYESAYTEQTTNNILQRYVMLMFTYNIRNFGSAGSRAQPEGDRPEGFGPGRPGGYQGGGYPGGGGRPDRD